MQEGVSLKVNFQTLKRGVFTHPLGMRAEARWGVEMKNLFSNSGIKDENFLR